jgi:hypothetical protein
VPPSSQQCYAFIDDTDVVHKAQDVNTKGEAILAQMQQVIDHWEGALQSAVHACFELAKRAMHTK